MLRKTRRRWWGLIPNGYETWIEVEKYNYDKGGKLAEEFCYFIRAKLWGGDIEYDQKDLEILTLPSLKKETA